MPKGHEHPSHSPASARGLTLPVRLPARIGPVTSPNSRRAIRWEIGLVLAITFGVSGLRSLLRLIEALASPQPLNAQHITLNQQQSDLTWLDPAFQLISTGVLFAWGGLALFLLWRHLPPEGGVHTPARNPCLPGAALAAVIGIPGLAFYIAAVHLGLSKQVAPSGLGDTPWRLPLLVLNAWANGFAEEVIVIGWLGTRLRQLRTPWPWIFAASCLLRGSYHLYQGVSAGAGNIVMGAVYLYYWKRTGRVWPLVIAHGLIDTLAFTGYAFLGDTPGL